MVMPIFVIDQSRHSKLLLSYKFARYTIIAFLLHLLMSRHVFQSCEQPAGNQCKFLENVQCLTVIMSPVNCSEAISHLYWEWARALNPSRMTRKSALAGPEPAILE